jgi:hypothetical protein
MGVHGLGEVGFEVFLNGRRVMVILLALKSIRFSLNYLIPCFNKGLQFL